MSRGPDVIWINGAFGVGKTTVAELRLDRIGAATVIDPELIGSMLRALLPSPWQTEDWQDIPLWRHLTKEAIHGLVRGGRSPLLVPMTIIDPDYLDQTVGALRRADVDVRHFTLIAGRETILSRLLNRDAESNQWARDRVGLCVERLGEPRFAEHLDAEGRDAAQIASEIVERIAA